jgi:hypothetical protein
MALISLLFATLAVNAFHHTIHKARKEKQVSQENSWIVARQPGRPFLLALWLFQLHHDHPNFATAHILDGVRAQRP